MGSLTALGSLLAERAGRKRDAAFIQQMEDWVVAKRARFIANSLSKSPNLDRYYLQKFTLETEAVDITDECNLDPSKCDAVYRTVVLPQPLRYNSSVFTYVGAPGGYKSFGWSTFGSEPYLRDNQLTGKNPRYTYTNDRVYVFNWDGKIQIEGVFADPRQLAKFRSCNDDGKSCYSDEIDFPIEEQTSSLIISEIVRELGLSKENEPVQIKEDKNV
jgi:hypothetical protein